jgi:hypothetical protein
LTQSSSTTPAQQAGKSSALLSILAGLFIACFFLFFTWRGLLVYYTGDDMMNLYGYWTEPWSTLIKQNVFFWTTSYRPFGGVIYRTLFAIFGFNPYPEYVIYFGAMIANLWLAYRLFTRLAGSREAGAVGTLLWAFHGKFDYLYYNAGSLYDVFCFLFFSSALLIYLRARAAGRFLGLWGTLGFLACFICALNSKEMAITLPAIVFLYELIFHPPEFRKLRAIVQWCWREGRMALVGAVCVLSYLPAKLGANGLAQDVAYVPSYTLGRWLQDTGTFLADIVYRNDAYKPLGVNPFSPLGIAIFYVTCLGVALWLRSRVALFGFLFFAITVLPVSFIPARLGFVLYLPLAGLALFGAVCLVRFKEALGELMGEALGKTRGVSLRSAIGLFVATAVVMAAVDYRNWPQAPDPKNSRQKHTIGELSGLYPKLPHGSRLLFVHSEMDDSWDLVFLLRNYYRDSELWINQINGPKEGRIPVDRLPHFDHIFDYEKGHYVELDNSDTLLALKFHLLKPTGPDDVFGEKMTIGKPGAAQYIMKGVLVGDAKSDAFWTLDQPELKFRLSSVEHHVFLERFYLPRETLEKTGPLIIDFYVNGHHLDQERFGKDGEVIYQHDVPEKWLTTAEPTTVRMVIHNPYIAPRDGARLGVLLRAASFNPPAVTL